MSYTIQNVQDHVEVYDEGGRFLFSADTWHEANEMLQMEGAA